MKLSPHFSLEELTVTGTGINNMPVGDACVHITKTAMCMEFVRQLLGNNPITVNSAYRSPAVNTAIGGSKTSAHMIGYAVDFTCPGFGSAEEVARHLKDKVQYDQLIWEHPPGKNPWVHISFDPMARGQVLEFTGKGYLPWAG